MYSYLEYILEQICTLLICAEPGCSWRVLAPLCVSLIMFRANFVRAPVMDGLISAGLVRAGAGREVIITTEIWR